jgi:hypothetical protein
MRSTIILLLLSAICLAGNSKNIRYVKTIASGTSDGSSWENASDNIQKIINLSDIGDEVWIAAGTYYPPENANKNWSLIPKDGISIYGSFSCSEKNVEDREYFDIDNDGQIQPWEFKHLTIISGDIKRNDDPEDLDRYTYSENVQRVIDMQYYYEIGLVIDGLSITGGYSSLYPKGDAAAMYISENIEVRNCRFENNYSASDNAGACWNKGRIIDCYFNNNHCWSHGGAIYNESYISGCLIKNSCSAGKGSAILNTGEVVNCIITENKCNSAVFSSGLISGCTISNNYTIRDGAGVYNYGRIENSTINNNVSEGRGGGIFNDYSGLVYNCQIFNNKAHSGGGGDNSGTIAFSNIFNNTSIEDGGGLSNSNSIINSTICNNKSGTSGGGVSNAAWVFNSVLWGNKANNHQQIQFLSTNPVTNCAIEGGIGTDDVLNNIINLSPLNIGEAPAMFYPFFASPSKVAGITTFTEQPDWSIASSQSALINNGENAIMNQYPNIEYTIHERNIDIGANEFVSGRIEPTIVVDFEEIEKLYGQPAFSLGVKTFPENLRLVFSSGNEKVARFTNDDTITINSIGETNLYIQFNGNETFFEKTIIVPIKIRYENIKTVFVAEKARGRNDGSSWENASSLLQESIDREGVEQIWVEAGTYYPTRRIDNSNNESFRSFILREGVNIYGGFSGTESSTNERPLIDLDGNGIIEPWEFECRTFLSGDIDSLKDDYSIWPETIEKSMNDNSSYVVYQPTEFNQLTFLDGVTIVGGNASEANEMIGGGIVLKKGSRLRNSIVSFNNSSNGAINANNTTISNCLISYNQCNNFGGGICLDNSTINGSKIIKNQSKIRGGGIDAFQSQIYNCEIAENSSVSSGGGYLYLSEMKNCEIHRNHAPESVGGIFLRNSTIGVSNIFQNHTSRGVGGVHIEENSKMNLCRVFFNKAIGQSLIGGGVFNSGTVSNSLVFGNKTESDNASCAGVFNAHHLVNSVVFNNESNAKILLAAGGVNNTGIMINNTICNNKANLAHQNVSNSGFAYNCAVWGQEENSMLLGYGPGEYNNGSTHHCAVQNGDGIIEGINGNLALLKDNDSIGALQYPRFKLPTTFCGYPQNEADSLTLFLADWSIGKNSTLKNKGTNSFIQATLPTICIDGSPRIISTIDIGAYEADILVETLAALAVSSKGATLSGKLLTSNTSNIIEYGFVLSKMRGFNPNHEGQYLKVSPSPASEFSIIMNDLDPFVQYFFMAYIADNMGNKEFGEVQSFFTRNTLSLNKDTIYVSQNYQGTGDGSSWENATANLAEAISASVSGSHIWIAEGIYKVNDFDPFNLDTKQYFTLKNGISYYGGFKGYESSINEREIKDLDGNGEIDPWEFSAKTILSADLDGEVDDYSNWPVEKPGITRNAESVMVQEYKTAALTLLNGLVFQGATNGGLSIKENTVVENCIVRYNMISTPYKHGGGIYNDRGLVKNSLIDNNHAYGDVVLGGGVMNNYGTIGNCIIKNCSATNGSNGAGIKNWYGVVDRCVVTGNFSDSYGAGIASYRGMIKNSIIFNNVGNSAAVYVEGYDTIVNCIIYNNTGTNGVGGVEDRAKVYHSTIVANLGNHPNSRNAGLFGAESFNNLLVANKNLNEKGVNLPNPNYFKRPSTFFGAATTPEQKSELENADWDLIETSYYIDKGDNSNIFYSAIEDIAGNNRVFHEKIDLGAYEFQGISNLAPNVSAGSNQNVYELQTVVLDGSASFDPEGNQLEYRWVSLNEIILTGYNTAVSHFIAPKVDEDITVSFVLTVFDGKYESSDTVKVTIKKATAIDLLDNTLEIKVFPLPCNQVLNIAFKTECSPKFEITNLMGQKVYNSLFSTNYQFSINVEQFLPGIYNLRTFVGGNVIDNRKFQIMR